jgi:hypothetical protein
MHNVKASSIVFHGERDTTVDPCNGEAVIAQCLGAAATVSEVESDALRTTVERGSVQGGEPTHARSSEIRMAA